MLDSFSPICFPSFLPASYQERAAALGSSPQAKKVAAIALVSLAFFGSCLAIGTRRSLELGVVTLFLPGVLELVIKADPAKEKALPVVPVGRKGGIWNRAKTAKVTLVALASLAFFSLQWGMRVGLSLKIAGALSLLTALSEAFIRTDSALQNDWMQTRGVDKKRLAVLAGLRLIVLPFFIFASSLHPSQGAGGMIRSGHLGILFLATVCGPFSEEILFRGFLQERMEDLLYLFRKVTRLSIETQKRIAAVLQGVFFGAIHMGSGQISASGQRGWAFALLSLSGWGYGERKNQEGSLLSPLVLHAAQNTGVCAGYLALGSS